MNWEKIKNDFTKDKPSSYYHITGSEYFGRWAAVEELGWIKKGHITKIGYETYLTILTVMGVDSIFGSPKRKQKCSTQLEKLFKKELIVFNHKTKKFDFGNNMPGYFTVLMLAMKGNAIPKL